MRSARPRAGYREAIMRERDNGGETESNFELEDAKRGRVSQRPARPVGGPLARETATGGQEGGHFKPKRFASTSVHRPVRAPHRR